MSIIRRGAVAYHLLQVVETLRTVVQLTVPTLFLCLNLNLGNGEDKY